MDVCVINPPFSINRGDGLYAKIIGKVYDFCDMVVSISPDSFILSRSKKYKKTKQAARDYYIELEHVMNEFDAGVMSRLLICFLDKTKENKIQYINNGVVYDYEKIDDILTYEHDEFMVEFNTKIKKFLSVNLADKYKLSKGYGRYVYREHIDEDPDKNCFYVVVYPVGSTKNEIKYKNTKVERYDDIDFNRSIGFFTFYDKNEANNFLDYISTDFVDLCVRYSVLDRQLMRYMFVPWLDFSKRWTDEELFSMIGMEYDKYMKTYK